MSRLALRFGSISLLIMLLIGLALPAYAATSVACSAAALSSAISAASNGDTLDLTAGCTYDLTTASTLFYLLPDIGITLTINGHGATIHRDAAAPKRTILHVSGNLILNDTTFTNGDSNDGGSAVYVQGGEAEINNSVISGGQAELEGGGIYVQGATLTLNHSTVSGNSTIFDEGAGLYNQGGTVIINDSTFSDNATGSFGEGGALYNQGGTVTITNSTFSGNSVGISEGGALYNQGGTVTITNSTFSGNSAGAGEGGGFYNLGGNVTLNNSIIANNPSGGDCVGAAISASHSLIMDSVNTCGVVNGVSGNIVGSDPLLGALTGSPAYFPLLSGSPVIDAGSNTLAVDANSNPLTSDEADKPRIVNGTVDMGAFEFTVSAPKPGGSTVSAPLSALCADVTSLANGAITVSGGVQNVLLNGVYGNTYCHLIASGGNFLTSPAEIGVPSVISLGVVDAVDVFGQLPGGESVVPFISPVTICLQGTGDVLFLSAADSSRTPQHLAATSSGGFLCVSVPNSGTVVLVGSASNIPPAPTAAPSDPASTTLDNCKVTTIHSPLNLRSEANTSATLIAQLPYNLTLTATAHESGWYQVIYGSGQGWVSDQFVSTAGDCG